MQGTRTECGQFAHRVRHFPMIGAKEANKIVRKGGDTKCGEVAITNASCGFIAANMTRRWEKRLCADDFDLANNFVFIILLRGRSWYKHDRLWVRFVIE